jgi:hypothetical protein
MAPNSGYSSGFCLPVAVCVDVYPFSSSSSSSSLCCNSHYKFQHNWPSSRVQILCSVKRTAILCSSHARVQFMVLLVSWLFSGSVSDNVGGVQFCWRGSYLFGGSAIMLILLLLAGWWLASCGLSQNCLVSFLRVNALKMWNLICHWNEFQDAFVSPAFFLATQAYGFWLGWPVVLKICIFQNFVCGIDLNILWKFELCHYHTTFLGSTVTTDLWIVTRCSDISGSLSSWTIFPSSDCALCLFHIDLVTYST